MLGDTAVAVNPKDEKMSAMSKSERDASRAEIASPRPSPFRRFFRASGGSARGFFAIVFFRAFSPPKSLPNAKL